MFDGALPSANRVIRKVKAGASLRLRARGKDWASGIHINFPFELG